MRTLILVDIQSDFLPGGSLAVPDGDGVIPVANRLQDHFGLVVATQDWHPADHGSFAATHEGRNVGEVIDLNGIEQILWPVHCVQETPGADFAPGLETGGIGRVFHKGTDPGIDSYSTFFDNGHVRTTGLTDYLRERGVTEVWLAGLATDYCVKFSALDAIKEGFKTCVVEDGCRGVGLAPGDVTKGIEEMRDAGVSVVQSDEVAGD